MKSIFGVNYFAFCFIVLALVLVFTKDMRDEGFFGMAIGFTNHTTIPELQGEGFFGMSPGTLTQLQSTHVPSPCSSSCSSLPSMSTSMMNPMSSPLGDWIQNNLTRQGIMNMTEVPKENPGFYTLI